MDAAPFLFLFAVFGYIALMWWLASVAEKDMQRRGRNGWALGSAVLLTSPVWPFWLLGWWAVRRRYPILDESSKVEKPERAA